jgi:hypothetical protein
MSSTIAALTNGTTVQSTDRIPAARSPYAPGDNVYLTPDELKAYFTSPITLAFADVATETSAGNLIDGQLYNITGFPAFTSGIQLQNIYVFAHLDNSVDASPLVILDNECVANYSSTGNQNQVAMRYNWYTSDIISIQDKFGNYIEGNTKCDNWPWGNDWKNNKFGYNFVLDMTVAPTSINNCVGLGSGTLTTTARVYENIDLDKGYFIVYGNITQSGTLNPPTLTVAGNELDETLGTTYDAAGIYRITSAVSRLLNAWVHIGNPDATLTAAASANYVADTRIDIISTQFSTPADDLLTNVPIEIRVPII